MVACWCRGPGRSQLDQWWHHQHQAPARCTRSRLVSPSNSQSHFQHRFSPRSNAVLVQQGTSEHEHSHSYLAGGHLERPCGAPTTQLTGGSDAPTPTASRAPRPSVREHEEASFPETGIGTRLTLSPPPLVTNAGLDKSIEGKQMRMNDPTAVWTNAGRNCKTRERVNFLGVVGQIEEWMEWEQLCKMFPPPPHFWFPSSPLHHNNPLH